MKNKSHQIELVTLANQRFLLIPESLISKTLVGTTGTGIKRQRVVTRRRRRNVAK